MVDNVMIFQLKPGVIFSAKEAAEGAIGKMRKDIQSQLPEGISVVLIADDVEYIRSECFEKSLPADKPDIKPFGGTPFAPTSLK